MLEMYAEVIVNSDAVDIDKPFTYKVKEEDLERIQVGHRVKVSFGGRNNLIEAFVIGLKCELYEEIKGLKKISMIVDKEPILTKDDLKLVDFLRRKYLCKYIDAIRVIIPVGLTSGIKNKKKQVIGLRKELDGKLKDKELYTKLASFIKANNNRYTKSELIKDYKFTSYSINKLIKEEFLEVTDSIVYRYNTKAYTEDIKNKLNEEQIKAINTILYGDNKGYLLKGVTGSGKTEVYMNLVDNALSEGKSAVILVPEIALTPQMIERFKGRFGKDVALFHSKLSQGERFDEWFRIKEGKARLVVGARSAIFLPVDNLGIIIIDEEHENTYKSEQNPKYDTREVAEFLSNIKDCKYILGSATPSVETYHKALNKELTLIEMKSRVKNQSLPEMKIVDMREELKAKNMSILSRQLKYEIEERLKKKEQVILFLNRRGFSTFVSCRSCGYVFKCSSCDIPMTHHKNGYLVCHLCGKTQKEEKTCPKCQSKYVKFFGAGTERVEIEVKKIFSEAKILRMDVDTTRYKNSHEKIYNSFKNGEADILIGTQMISKGLDFKNVTLVGILAADMSLNIPDYRSGERTFQIVTQVSGRAGRGEKKGKVIIQSYTPENAVLGYAVSNNYNELYKEEIKVRKVMNYPPFSKILLINVLCKDEEKLKDFMKVLQIELKKIECKEELEVLGPSPCIITKIKEFFRWQIVIKGNFGEGFSKMIKDKLYHLNKNVYNEIRVSIDINPNNMI